MKKQAMVRTGAVWTVVLAWGVLAHALTPWPPGEWVRKTEWVNGQALVERQIMEFVILFGVVNKTGKEILPVKFNPIYGNLYNGDIYYIAYDLNIGNNGEPHPEEPQLWRVFDSGGHELASADGLSVMGEIEGWAPDDTISQQIETSAHAEQNEQLTYKGNHRYLKTEKHIPVAGNEYEHHTLYGLMDITDKVILPAIYDRLTWDKTAQMLVASKNGKKSYFALSGQKQTHAAYESQLRKALPSAKIIKPSELVTLEDFAQCVDKKADRKLTGRSLKEIENRLTGKGYKKSYVEQTLCNACGDGDRYMGTKVTQYFELIGRDAQGNIKRSRVGLFDGETLCCEDANPCYYIEFSDPADKRRFMKQVRNTCKSKRADDIHINETSDGVEIKFGEVH